MTEQTGQCAVPVGEGPLETPEGVALPVPSKSHGTWRGSPQRKGGAGRRKQQVATTIALVLRLRGDMTT